MTTTHRQVEKSITTSRIVAETIRELGSVGEETLYAASKSRLDTADVRAGVERLVAARLVFRSGGMLTWMGKA